MSSHATGLRKQIRCDTVATHDEKHHICACSHISERMLTYGDVGTPVDELEEEFAPLKGNFCDVEAGSWWHGGGKNCQKKGTFSEKETSAQFKVRAARAPATYHERSAFVSFTMLQNLWSRVGPPDAHKMDRCRRQPYNVRIFGISSACLQGFN